MNATHALLSGLIDYAGLFPPAQLEMVQAVEEYAALRAGPYAWMSGRFIVPASRLPEFDAAVAARAPFPLSVIIDAGQDARSWFNAAKNRIAAVSSRASQAHASKVEILECPLPVPLWVRETFDAPIGQLSALLSNAKLGGLPAYVELPHTEHWHELLPNAFSALARYKLRAKIRCGGAPELTPTVEELAAFIVEACLHDTAFKATAGLHHPLPYEEPASKTIMHGFLNLLAASTFAQDATMRTLLPSILAERNRHAFVITESELRWNGHIAGLAQIETARGTGFISYGSCSFAEPVDELIALGFLPSGGVNAIVG